ncbi:MAG: hypothetical protein AAGD01_16635 [Acidobacteriota bacterium]
MTTTPVAPDRSTAALLDLLESSHGAICQTLERFDIETEEADEILDELAMVLAHRFDQLSDPRRWLLSTLERRCLLSLHHRRETLARRTELEIEEWLDVHPEALREQRHQQLQELIDRLPRASQRVLRRRWPLEEDIPIAAPPPPAAIGPSGRRIDPILRCLHQLLHTALDRCVDA